jgi:hypothetical protein
MCGCSWPWEKRKVQLQTSVQAVAARTGKRREASYGARGVEVKQSYRGVLPTGGRWARFCFKRRKVLLLCCGRENRYPGGSSWWS